MESVLHKQRNRSVCDRGQQQSSKNPFAELTVGSKAVYRLIKFDIGLLEIRGFVFKMVNRGDVNWKY